MAITVQELVTRLGFEVDQDKVEAYDKAVGRLKVGLLAVVGAAAGATAALFAIAKSSARAGDDVAKTSALLGLSVEEFQSYRHAADLAGVGAEGFGTALQFLTRNIGDAARGEGSATKAFQRLGISVNQLQGMTTGEQLRLVADRMSGVTSVTERASLSMDLFGRSGARMGVFLSKGSEELDRATQAIRLFGFFNAEQSRQAEEVTDGFTRLTAILGGLRNEIGIRLFPVVRRIQDAIEGWFIRNEKVIKQRLDQVFAKAVPIAKALGAAIVALGAAAAWGAIVAGIKLVTALGSAFFIAWGKALLGPALIAAAVFLVIAAIDEMWVTIQGGESVIGDLNRWLGELVAGGSKVAAFFDGVLEVIAGFWSVVIGMFTGNKSLVLEGFRAMFGDLVEAVKRGIQALVEIVPEPIRKAAGLVGKALAGPPGAGSSFAAGAPLFATGFGSPVAFAPSVPSPLALAGNRGGAGPITIHGGPITVPVMPGTTAGQAQDVGRAVEDAVRRQNMDLAREIKRRSAP